MSTERKNTLLKRDHALNDATNGQLGKDPRLEPHVDRLNLKLTTILEIHVSELLAKCLETCNTKEKAKSSSK